MSSRACFRREDDPKLVRNEPRQECVGPLHSRGRDCGRERRLIAEISTTKRPGGRIRLQQAQQAVGFACWSGNNRGGKRSCGNERDSRKKRGEEYRTHSKRVTAEAMGKRNKDRQRETRLRQRRKSSPKCLINAKPANSSCHGHE